MIEPFLKSRLEPVARRRWLWGLSRDLAVCWASAATVGLIFYLVYRQTVWIPTWIMPTLALAALIGALCVWTRHRRWQPDFRQIARDVEQRHPELHALLLTAVEQQPDGATGKFNFLQERLLSEAVQEAGAHTGWLDTISKGRLSAMHVTQGGAFVLLLLTLAGLRVQTKEAVALAKPTRVQVSPGDVTIERGNGLAVLARFDGPLPTEVTMVIRPDAQPERKVTLVKSLNDPVFGATIPEVTNSLTYRVTYAGGHSRDFKVDTFEYPRLERADAHLVFPDYTGLAEKNVPDTRRVSAVQGSTLDLSLQLNKPVASARLVSKDKKVLPLTAATNQANASLNKFSLQSSQIYDLVLVDAAGRTNKVPTQIVLDVLTNRAPELTFVSPRGDQRVSPLEEIKFQGETWDDFGLKSYGITYSLAGGKSHTVVLADSPAAAREKRQFTNLVSLEELKAEPDQFLSYFIWADDIGPDGQIRRTASDMYYAEVRPFDEIFREGQSRSQSEESGQEGNETTKLAELQKQIINATWRLQRDNHVGLDQAADAMAPDTAHEQRPATPNYGKDVDVVEQSQKQALKQASARKERTESAQGKALWANVEKEMTKAAEQLGKAAKSTEPLPGALASEQAAYQALLKLASHEFQVAQGRRGRNQGANQPNQRQLEQLDLKQSENRYENQKQAAAQQNPEQREQLQVLNRLKELAQRQQDMNQRLKELQTALQEAKSEQEKEDIRRRLKRLREEEQQMLADVDELLQRMDRPENQSRMADARQQLEQTRNQVQRASEMIDKQSVGQALSSGTRAERELKDLEEQVRKKSSAQFAQEMRQMRTDARDLAQKEDQVSEKMKSLAEGQRKTLSDSGETKQLVSQLGQQTQKMTNLLDQMTRVSQDAEASEPLLSKQLYDTVRKASQSNGEDSLQKAGELLKMSFFDQAKPFEQRAHKEIEDIKQGVEHAAESVLGDETEALRLARNELDDLERQVRKEIAQADQAGAKSGAQAGQQPDAQKAAGEQQQGQNGAQQSATGQRGNAPGQANQRQQDGQSPGQQQGQNGAQQAAARQRGNTPGQANQGQQDGQSSGQQQGQNGDQQAAAGQRGNTPGQANQGQQDGQQGRSGRQPGAQAQSQSDSQQPSQANATGQGSGQGNPRQAGRQPQQGQGQPRQRASLSGRPGQAPGGTNPGNIAGQGNRAGEGGGEGGDQGAQRAPITGEGYADWSDRLRNVEELLDVPDLRNEVAGVRDRARYMRLDFKKQGKAPQWDVVRAQIAQPLAEVRSRINEELARRESKDSLVPIDRDPVPQKFSELVRRYYEKLGSGAPTIEPKRD